MFPIVKHLNPRATDGSSLFARGQEMVAQGFLKDGYQLINEALQLFTSVYGNIHTDVINAYRYTFTVLILFCIKFLNHGSNFSSDYKIVTLIILDYWQRLITSRAVTLKP